MRLQLFARVLAAGLVAACSAAGPAVGPRGNEPPEKSRARLERERAANPQDFEVRMALGETFYRLARAALDSGDEATYVEQVGQAHGEFVEATALRPAHPEPHLWMGIVLAYQSDMPAALESFKNARRLDPRQPVHYTNLAEVYIYLGRTRSAATMLKHAQRLGAPYSWVERNEILAAWKAGDLVEAREIFDLLYSRDPEFLQIWDEARVSPPIRSFRDFAAYCCGNPACGPHMEDACKESQLEVTRRELERETLLKQYEQERERRRRLREIYDQNKDVQIEIEGPDDDR